MAEKTTMEQRPVVDVAALTGNNLVYNVYKDSRHDSPRIHIGDKNVFNQNVNTREDHLRSYKGAQDRLEEYVSRGAAHDSAERGMEAPKCFPETRETVQGEVMSFVDPGGEEKMLWLSGPAGAGKTAIMGSICEECQTRGWLAGSFFFSISTGIADRCSKRYLVPTLAYQFFQLAIPGLPGAILASIDANPSVFDKRLDQQVDILLLRPLRAVCKAVESPGLPRAVVVDGVDECAADERRNFDTEEERRRSREENQREVLLALKQASQDPAFPFKIIIASRPERVIQECMSSHRHRGIFLDSKFGPETDIELYSRAMLNKIGRDWGLQDGWFNEVFPVDWPQDQPSDMPRYFAKESSGQFIYPATVIRFVQDGSDTPQKQLERVLGWRGGDSSNPFAALDRLYAGIMHTSPKPAEAALWVRAAGERLSEVRVGRGLFISALLQSSPGQMGHLRRLSALVRIIDEDGQPDFHIYHKSLIDFLGVSERSGDLYVPWGLSMAFLWSRYYEILKGRGPQVSVIPPGSIDMFLGDFCDNFPMYFPPSRQYEYTHDDVDWWLGNFHLRTAPDAGLVLIYHKVHRDCRGYNSRRACKVWRRGLLQYAKANGWRVPTMLEELQDRVRPFPWVERDSRGILIEDILHPLEGSEGVR